ncbi:MAG: FecR family protein [Treponema sp.]|jgi:hypothetical protein|nr:FecR family protein [Treponema sp.]
MKQLVFLSVCVTTLCLTLSTLCAEEIVTRIDEITGKVEVKTANSASWIAAQKGMTLKKDDQVSTSFKSSAVLTIGRSKVTVRALTRLSVEEISRGGGQEQVKLSMPAGTIRAEVKAPEGGKIEFSVRSPSATASVRGTEFSLDTKKLTVIEGAVALVNNSGKTTQVNAGRSATVGAKGKVSSANARGSELYPSLPVGLGSVAVPVVPTPVAVPVETPPSVNVDVFF